MEHAGGRILEREKAKSARMGKSERLLRQDRPQKVFFGTRIHRNRQFHTTYEYSPIASCFHQKSKYIKKPMSTGGKVFEDWENPEAAKGSGARTPKSNSKCLLLEKTYEKGRTPLGEDTVKQSHNRRLQINQV